MYQMNSEDWNLSDLIREKKAGEIVDNRSDSEILDNLTRAIKRLSKTDDVKRRDK